jgi:hypothetical protein
VTVYLPGVLSGDTVRDVPAIAVPVNARLRYRGLTAGRLLSKVGKVEPFGRRTVIVILWFGGGAGIPLTLACRENSS